MCIWWHRHQMQFWQSNNCQCIWRHRHQMQLWQFHQQTIVSVHLTVSQLNAAVLASKQSSVHLMTSISNAALTILFTNSRQNIWSFHNRMQFFWHHIHLNNFLIVIEDRWLISYTFIWFFFKLNISHQHFNQNHFYIVNTCNLSEKFQK